MYLIKLSEILTLTWGSHVVCAVNPRTSFETKYPERDKAANPKTVAIVGAGPAGLAAAVTLKNNGHNVVVFETADGIGGKVRIGKNPPKEDQLGWLIEDYEKQVKELGIDLRLNQAADPETVKALHADVVLLAVGAQAIVPNIPGVSDRHVYSVEQVLRGETELKDQTIGVIGSGLTGLETAELLQQSAK